MTRGPVDHRPNESVQTPTTKRARTQKAVALFAGWAVTTACLVASAPFGSMPAHALTPADCDPFLETWWGSTDPQNPTGGGCELKAGYELTAVKAGWALSVGPANNGFRPADAIVPADYKGKDVVEAQIWGIRSVDLSRASRLKSLGVDNDEVPSSEWVADLDLSGAPALTELDITAPNLEALNLASNAELRIVNLLRTKVSTLDLTNQSKLTELSLDDTPVESLNLAGQSKLTSLQLTNAPLTNLDLRANSALKSLVLMGTNIASLSDSLAKLPKLNSLTLAQNKVQSLDLRKNPGLTFLSLAEASLTSVNLSKNKSLKSLLLTDSDPVTYEAVYSPSLKKLDVSNNRKLIQLVVERATSLKKLDVSKLNRLLELQFQGIPGLKVKVSRAHNPRLELVTYSPKSLDSEKTEYGPRYAKWKTKTFANARV